MFLIVCAVLAMSACKPFFERPSLTPQEAFLKRSGIPPSIFSNLSITGATNYTIGGFLASGNISGSVEALDGLTSYFQFIDNYMPDTELGNSKSAYVNALLRELKKAHANGDFPSFPSNLASKEYELRTNQSRILLFVSGSGNTAYFLWTAEHLPPER